MTDITKNKNYRLAYVLDQSGLEQFLFVLKKIYAHVQIEMKTSDDMVFTFYDPSELINYQNIKGSHIVELRLSTPPYQLEEKKDIDNKLKLASNFVRISPQVKIVFGKPLTGFSKSVDLFVSGGDVKEVNYYFDEMYKSLVSVKRSRPYSFLALVDLVLLFFGILAVPWLLLGFYILANHVPLIPNDGSDVSKSIYIMIITFVILEALVLIISTLINRLRQLIFPVSTFAFGAGIRRHKQLESIRTYIFLGIVCTFFLGIAINWVSHLIIK